MYRKRRLLINAATLIPGVAEIPFIRRKIRDRVVGTGGTISGRYCYSVWLRHLTLAMQSGRRDIPQTIAELGPGDSLGIGLAALLSGASRYLAFDVVPHAQSDTNERVLGELLELFKCRAAIPNDDEFPGVFPRLNDYRFPAEVLTEQRLAASLAPERIEKITESLRHLDQKDSMVQYRAPWFSEAVIDRGSIDMVYSQAVLEHVDELPEVYRCMHAWLAEGGFMSHQVDLTCHGWAEQWNGHWAHSDVKWRLIRGRDSWFINRAPKSAHLNILRTSGFSVVRSDSYRQPNSLEPRSLAKRYRGLGEDDLTTCGLFFQAVKG